MLVFKQLHLKRVVVFNDAKLDFTGTMDSPVASLIVGRNNDTQTETDQTLTQSNGAGKSLLLSTLAMVLYGSPPLSRKKNSRKEVLYHVDSKNPSMVHVELETLDPLGTKTAYSIFQYPTQYRFLKNGQDQQVRTIERCKELIEEHITYRLSEEDFYTYLYLTVQRPLEFLYGSDTRRAELINNLFRFGVYDALREKFLEKQRDTRSAVQAINSLLEDRVKMEQQLQQQTQELAFLLGVSVEDPTALLNQAKDRVTALKAAKDQAHQDLLKVNPKVKACDTDLKAVAHLLELEQAKQQDLDDLQQTVLGFSPKLGELLKQADPVLRRTCWLLCKAYRGVLLDMLADYAKHRDFQSKLSRHEQRLDDLRSKFPESFGLLEGAEAVLCQEQSLMSLIDSTQQQISQAQQRYHELKAKYSKAQESKKKAEDAFKALQSMLVTVQDHPDPESKAYGSILIKTRKLIQAKNISALYDLAFTKGLDKALIKSQDTESYLKKQATDLTLILNRTRDSAVCPTCKQTVDTSALQAVIQDTHSKLQPVIKFNRVAEALLAFSNRVTEAVQVLHDDIHTQGKHPTHTLRAMVKGYEALCDQQEAELNTLKQAGIVYKDDLALLRAYHRELESRDSVYQCRPEAFNLTQSLKAVSAIDLAKAVKAPQLFYDLAFTGVFADLKAARSMQGIFLSPDTISFQAAVANQQKLDQIIQCFDQLKRSSYALMSACDFYRKNDDESKLSLLLNSLPVLPETTSLDISSLSKDALCSIRDDRVRERKELEETLMEKTTELHQHDQAIASFGKSLNVISLYQNQYEELTAKLSNLEKTDAIKHKPIVESLVAAYSAKGLINVAINEVAGVLKDKLNLFSPLLYGENVTFDIRASSGGVVATYLFDNSTQASDVRMMSGSESHSFALIFLLAVLSMMPSQRRSNLVVLDEMDSHMDEVCRNRFYTQYLPVLKQVIPNVFVVTPKFTGDDAPQVFDNVIKVVKQQGVSTLCIETPGRTPPL